MTKKIGFYGGTFDPLHIGHLNLAVEVLEKKPLDEVWFCPARLSPGKLNEQPQPIEHRLKMIERVLAGNPYFRLLDLESKREGPSYTIDTLRELVKQHPSFQFHLILGDDSITDFFRWKQPEEIVRLVPLVIGCRTQDLHIKALEGDSAVVEAIHAGYLNTRVMEIAATEVRARLQQGLYCGHLLPKEVIDYINEFHLY